MTEDEFNELEIDDWVYTNKMPEGVRAEGFVRSVDEDTVTIEWLDGGVSVLDDYDERIAKMEVEAKPPGGAT